MLTIPSHFETRHVYCGVPCGLMGQVNRGGQTIFEGGLAVDDGGVKISTTDTGNSMVTLNVAMQPPNQYFGTVLRMDGYQVRCWVGFVPMSDAVLVEFSRVCAHFALECPPSGFLAAPQCELQTYGNAGQWSATVRHSWRRVHNLAPRWGAY